MNDWQRSVSLWLMPFPWLSRLLSPRLNTQQITGLPLTLALMAVLALMLLLSGLVEDVVEQDTIVQFDYWVATTMAQVRTDALVTFFDTMTQLGNTKIVLPLLLLALTSLVLWGNRFWALPLVLSFVGSMTMAALGKYGFARPRPIEALFVEHSPSFPSAHATLAMAFYAVLFYLWWRRTSHRSLQMMIAIMGMTFVTLLASSRIIIGVHYVSDVIAGLLLGGLWFVIAISLYEWLNAKQYIQLRTHA